MHQRLTLITIEPPCCRHEPDAKVTIEGYEPLSDSDRTRIEEDIQITVAGPVATALSRGQSRAKIKHGTGLTSLGGASDEDRLRDAIARLRPGMTETDLIDEWPKEELKTRREVLKALPDDVWVRIKAAAKELVEEETLEGDPLRTLMETLLSP